MASSTQNQKDYERAKTAYITGNYDQAATLIEKLAQESPKDPEILLLRGHIYCCFQEYEQAQEQYNLVIENTENEDYIECANSGLEKVRQWQEGGGFGNFSEEPEEDLLTTQTGEMPSTNISNSSLEEEETGVVSEGKDWQFEAEEDEATNVLSGGKLDDPFADFGENSIGGEGENNPFGELSEDDITAISALDDEDEQVTNLANSDSLSSENSQNRLEDDPYTTEAPEKNNNNDETPEARTLLYASPNSSSSEEEFDFSEYEGEEFVEDSDEGEDTFGYGNTLNQREDSQTANHQTGSDQLSEEGEITDIGMGSGLGGFTQKSHSSQAREEKTSEVSSESLAQEEVSPQLEKEADSNQVLFADSSEKKEGELFSANDSEEKGSDVSLDVPESSVGEPVIEQDQGVFAFLENASLTKKQQILASVVGAASAVVVAVGSFTVSSLGETKPGFLNNLTTSSLLGLVGGAASGAVTWVMGGVMVQQVKRSTGDLQAQLYAVQQGNLEAKATVYSQDEFGRLATGFNQMTRVVSSTTKEAQRKAQEQEQAKEDLQRQVIRLLDDVEGAARGDLTVQAEVSADVLGAVADAFNLTIRNLRDIVQQVKEAARQVNEGAAESSSFARGLSEDALQQAEELAVSLNSSQMMTESIQRVADNAREAESVARSASETALKGGEAVDSTVAGILQIRETVAQSTRKVKRLAESSQEISKIVSVISQIATRTNNLALNASIEAARAGEAGRGFAVIADEVRQLADRSTKSLREIEKIVLQIQSETSSVMVAMEEGTQQVIEGTQRAEQAKDALEDIIQVSNRIDSLVQSITADTVEQSETAQSVAQVMQSVEMTAQGTSKESQQVSTALQNLVSLAGELLASVERFRVNPEDELSS